MGQVTMDEGLLGIRAALRHESEHHAIVLLYGFQFTVQFRILGIEQNPPDTVQGVVHAA